MNTKLLLWPFLVILYILLLSFNLLQFPLYLDEGIYIFWSYLFSGSQGFAYISMQDGKTPLFIWLTSFINPLLNNFLFSARFLSVIGSALSLISFAVIAGKIFGLKKSYLIFILFLVAPFNILISRLAFVDSLLIGLSSLSILGIFLLRESVSKKQISKSLIFASIIGISLGLAFFTKTTAKVFLVAGLVVLGFWGLQFLKGKNFKAVVLLAVSAAVIAGLYFELQSYLKFGALRHWEMIANKEAILVFTPEEVYRKFFIEGDYRTHILNLAFWGEYFLVYFGPLLLFFIAGIYWILKQRKHFWILIIFVILLGAVLLSARIPASRYLAIIIPEFLLISYFGLLWLWEKKSQSLKIISILLLVISGFFSLRMIFMPLNAYYSHDDQGNFLDSHLSALGLNESVQYLVPRKDIAAVAVTGIWGVAEGSQVAFKEKGIETYVTGKVIDSAEIEEGLCEENFQELDGKCWKIDFGQVTESSKPEKYIYFMSNHIDIETLKKLADIEVILEFNMKDPTQNVYLLRLNRI